MHKFLFLLLLVSTAGSPLFASDEEYKKAEIYTLSVLFKPLSQYCDRHVSNPDQRYSKSFHTWYASHLLVIREGETVAHKLIEQMGDKPGTFYQLQIDELLAQVKQDEQQQLELKCDRLRAKLERFTLQPITFEAS